MADDADAPITVGLVVSWPWTDAILDEIKTIETREYALPAGLEGTRIALIETDNPDAENARVVGSVVFYRSDQYMEQDEWEDDSGSHLVAADDANFGWDPRKEKWAWLLAEGSAQRIEEPISCPPTIVLFRSLQTFANPLTLLAATPAPTLLGEEVEEAGKSTVVVRGSNAARGQFEMDRLLAGGLSRGGTMDMRKWEHVPVGFSFEPHTHPADICGFVTKGVAVWVIGKERYVLKKGDSYYLKSGEIYGLERVEEEFECVECRWIPLEPISQL